MIIEMTYKKRAKKGDPNTLVTKKYMAIEVNKMIIPKSEYAEYLLKENDIVEVINAVGGG